MKFKNLAVQMAERGYSVSAWGRSRGLSDNDIYILRELCKNTMKGVWGRGAQIRKMLESEGFKFKLKANRKKSKFVNFDNGENNGGLNRDSSLSLRMTNKTTQNGGNLHGVENGGNLVDCFVSNDTRNDAKSVDSSFCVRKTQSDGKITQNDGDSAVSRAVGGF